MRVMGVDIETRSSPNSSEPSKYSAVILDEGGNVIDKAEGVTLSRIVRLSWEYSVNKLATDNIYELGSDDRDVIRVLSLMPDNMEVVQVTFKDGTFVDLREVAKEHGIEVQGKPTPSKTAYLVALLALKGAGTKIRFVENRTKIVVSKGRRTGPGGMSSNRYKRHLRGLVLRVFRRIKEELDKHNFDYDVLMRRTKAGLESAVFIVYAPRESLYGIVKKMSGHDVNVEIRAIYRDRIEFMDRKTSSQRPLIVGIDPGLEVGLSALDMYGNPVLLETKRGIDRETVIEILQEKGIPALIATDVNPVPDSVKKLAAVLKAKLHVPERILSVDEKQNLLNEYSAKYGLNVSDPHVRDSLAAAIVAYRDVEKKLRQAEGMIERFGIEMDRNVVFRCVIEGNTIAECIEKEIDRKIWKQRTEVVQEPKSAIPQNQEVEKIREENQALKYELLRLRRLVGRLVNEKEALERRIQEIKVTYNAEVDKDRRIEGLKAVLEQRGKEVLKLREDLAKLSGEISRLQGVIHALVTGNPLVINGCGEGFEVREGRLYYRDWEIREDMALYVGKNFAVVDRDLEKDLKMLWREAENIRAKQLDEEKIKKIIEEYRISRGRAP